MSTITFPTPSYWLEREPNEHGGEKHYTVFAGSRFDMFGGNPPLGWYREEQDAIDACWAHHYRQLTDERNKKVDFYDYTLGYRVGDDHIYHPECLPSGFHLPEQVITIDSDNILNLLCEQCDESLLDDDHREEFFDHEQNCDCEECMKASVKAEQGYSENYIVGYKAGLGGYAKNRGMTPLEYIHFRQFIPATPFIEGYEDALKENEEENKGHE